MKLAIIGGSLLNEFSHFTRIAEERIKTPFGNPSDHFVTGNIEGMEIVYFNRHGESHHLAPHLINYKANMFVLKILDVTHVLSVTAVGGITAAMSPMKWVVPDQIIDYTHGRAQTYNGVDEKHVSHIDFSYPFDEALSRQLMRAMDELDCHYESTATYGVTQGPRLETVAEIRRMQRDGCDIVGMTAMPEAALARELDMKYATLSLVVNWAAGVTDTVQEKGERAEIISMEEISRRIEQGNRLAEDIVRKMIAQLKTDGSLS